MNRNYPSVHVDDLQLGPLGSAAVLRFDCCHGASMLDRAPIGSPPRDTGREANAVERSDQVAARMVDGKKEGRN